MQNNRRFLKQEHFQVNKVSSYIKNPTVTKQRMFYETMEEVLPDLELIIDSSNGVQKILPLDSFLGSEGTSNTEKGEN